MDPLELLILLQLMKHRRVGGSVSQFLQSSPEPEGGGSFLNGQPFPGFKPARGGPGGLMQPAPGPPGPSSEPPEVGEGRPEAPRGFIEADAVSDIRTPDIDQGPMVPVGGSSVVRSQLSQLDIDNMFAHRALMAHPGLAAVTPIPGGVPQVNGLEDPVRRRQRRALSSMGMARGLGASVVSAQRAGSASGVGGSSL